MDPEIIEKFKKIKKDPSNKILDKDIDKDQNMCKICNLICKNPYNARQHIRLVHIDMKLECEYCGIIVSSDAKLRNHVISDHREHSKNYKCNSCPKKYPIIEFLYKHIKKYHPTSFDCEEKFINCNDVQDKNLVDNGFPCSICGEYLKTSQGRVKHYNDVHDDGKTLLRTCQVCNIGFPYFKEYKIHIDSHLKPELFCLKCGQQFSSEIDLNIHKITHRPWKVPDEKKYLCDFCDYKSKKKGGMTTHLRKHTKETPFVCDICGKGYRNFSTFEYHRKAHTGIRDNVSFL